LRCQLALSSIASIGTQVPGELLTECIKNGLLTPYQALHWVELQDIRRRAKALVVLAPLLPEAERAGVVSDALAAARAIQIGSGELVALAPLLPTALLGAPWPPPKRSKTAGPASRL
jgi:hypothetical protein